MTSGKMTSGKMNSIECNLIFLFVDNIWFYLSEFKIFSEKYVCRIATFMMYVLFSDGEPKSVPETGEQFL
jgi:hypothetical protein